MSFFEQIAATTIGILLGTVIASVVTGLMANKFIVKRIMRNRDIQDLILLIREGKEQLRKILEEQKKRNGESKP